MTLGAGLLLIAFGAILRFRGTVWLSRRLPTRSALTNSVMSPSTCVEDRGGLRSQFTHVSDFGPTILDVVGIPQPGCAQLTTSGVRVSPS
jgi:hypothetical protein